MSLIKKKWQFAFVSSDMNTRDGAIFWLLPKQGYNLPLENWKESVQKRGGRVIVHPETKQLALVFKSASDRTDFLSDNPMKVVSEIIKNYTKKALRMIGDDALVFRTAAERDGLKSRLKNPDYLESAVGIIFPFLLSFEDYVRADRRYHAYLLQEASKTNYEQIRKLREQHLLACTEAAVESHAIHVENLKSYAFLNKHFVWTLVPGETEFYRVQAVRDAQALFKELETTRTTILALDSAARNGEIQPELSGSIFAVSSNYSPESLSGQEIALQRFAVLTKRNEQFQSFAPLYFTVKLKQEKARSLSNLRALKEIAARNNPKFDISKHYLFADREINWTLVDQAVPHEEMVKVINAGDEFRALTGGGANEPRQLSQ